MLPGSPEICQAGFDLLAHIDLIHQIIPACRVRQITDQPSCCRFDFGSRSFDGGHEVKNVFQQLKQAASGLG